MSLHKPPLEEPRIMGLKTIAFKNTSQHGDLSIFTRQSSSLSVHVTCFCSLGIDHQRFEAVDEVFSNTTEAHG